jgi:hypothetical protein
VADGHRAAVKSRRAEEGAVALQVKIKRSANCHPEQPYYAKGLCQRCYDLARLERTGRRPKRRTKLMGLRNLGEGLPERVAGVEHRALVAVPWRCPKCENPLLIVEGRRVACPGSLAGCGWDAFLIAEADPTPASVN